MKADNQQDILVNPKFKALVKARNTVAWTMSVIVLVIYFGYIALVAYAKPFMAEKVGGGTTSVGILIGLGVIISAIIMTGIYVAIANTRFDAMTRDLKRDFNQ